MSLYNLVMGLDKDADRLLTILNKVQPLNIPRFRDCYIKENNDKYICVLTRTGGGNREEYQVANEMMTNHPLYVNDEDCEWDITYAEFYFRIPNEDEMEIYGLQ
jgi:hypothetical protein